MRLIVLELPRSQKSMNFTVSEDPNLLICERTLHSVWIVSEIVVCGLVIFLGKHSQLLPREVLKLEGFEVILEEREVRKHLITDDGEAYQSYTWDLHGGVDEKEGSCRGKTRSCG